jgi:hypothetical protein
VEVDEDEAIKGYLRQSDYTKKTQALAEARKKLEQEELPAVQKERQEYAATLTELRKLVEANTPREPNWEKLKAELPPGEYAAKWVEWDQHQKHLADLKQVEQAATAKVQQDAVSRQNANAQAAFERTLELIPEWKDETKGKAERQAIVEYAGTLGFTQQDLASITRPELMVVLRDAARYHTLQANAKNPPKNVKPAAAVLKPGGANERVRPPSSDLEKAVKNLKRTGSERDAASAIRNLPGLNL